MSQPAQLISLEGPTFKGQEIGVTYLLLQSLRNTALTYSWAKKYPLIVCPDSYFVFQASECRFLFYAIIDGIAKKAIK